MFASTCYQLGSLERHNGVTTTVEVMSISTYLFSEVLWEEPKTKPPTMYSSRSKYC